MLLLLEGKDCFSSLSTIGHTEFFKCPNSTAGQYQRSVPRLQDMLFRLVSPKSLVWSAQYRTFLLKKLLLIPA